MKQIETFQKFFYLKSSLGVHMEVALRNPACVLLFIKLNESDDPLAAT